MTIATAPRHHLTEEEFLRLPDDGRKWELVNGEPKEVPTRFDHDPLIANLVGMLLPLLRGKGAITTGQSGFRMKNGNIRCPDFSYTRKERIPGGKPGSDFGSVAPDLCVEIISPTEERADMQKKVREYFDSGAEQVWHVFPETQTVWVFNLLTASQEFSADDELDGGSLLPGFHCRVADIFDTGL